MAIIRQMKSLWGVMGTFREISDVLNRPRKMLREAVSIGLPSWDPPEPEPPRPPDQETVDRVMEVIGMGNVEEREAFSRVMGTWRKITTGAPREPAQEEVQGAVRVPSAGGEREEDRGAEAERPSS